LINNNGFKPRQILTIHAFIVRLVKDQVLLRPSPDTLKKILKPMFDYLGLESPSVKSSVKLENSKKFDLRNAA